MSRLSPVHRAAGTIRRGWAPWLVALALLGLVVEAWAPFRPAWPVWSRQPPTRAADDGSLQFNGRAVLVGLTSPWLDEASRSGRLQLQLTLRSGQTPQRGPARILTVSRDPNLANLTVGQQGADLVVRFRRPGSDPTGAGPLVVPGVFTAPGWHAVDLIVEPGQAVLTVDRRPAGQLGLPADSLGTWDRTLSLALGDEAVGERPWKGDLAEAIVTTPHSHTDLLAADVTRPDSRLVVAERVRGLVSLRIGDPLLLVAARVLTFVPLGVGLAALGRRRRTQVRQRPRRPDAASASVIAAVAFGLTIGKLFVAGRHPSLLDAAVGSVGGLGALALASRHKHDDQWSSSSGSTVFWSSRSASEPSATSDRPSEPSRTSRSRSIASSSSARPASSSRVGSDPRLLMASSPARAADSAGDETAMADVAVSSPT